MRKQMEIDQYEDIDVGLRIVLKLDVRVVGWGGMDWMGTIGGLL